MKRFLALALSALTLLAGASAFAVPAGQIPGSFQPDVLRAVTDKTGMLGGVSGTQISSGSTSSTYRVVLHTPTNTGFANPQLIYACAYIIGASEDAACPNAITIKAVIAIGSTNYPVSCGGTTSSVALGVGAVIVCDPVGVTVPASTTVDVCTYVTVASGGWPNGRPPSQSGNGEGSSGTNGADDTGACAAGTGMTTGGYMFGPHAIVGHPLIKGLPVVGCLGDSRYAGSGDTLETAQATGYAGPCERGLGTSLAWLTSDRSSDLASTFVGHSSWRMAYFPQFITTLINELGINDITGGASAATVEGNLQALWTEFQSRGIYVCQETILPKTTSSDFYATAANETPFAQEAVRQAVNIWIRANTTCLIDSDALVEVNSSGTLDTTGGRYLIPASEVVTTGNTHTTTTIDNIPSTTGWVVGHQVCGSGVPVNDGILSKTSTSVVLASATTSTLTGTSIVYDCPTSDGTHPTPSTIAVTQTAVSAAVTSGQIR